jgi:hypothetical protein
MALNNGFAAEVSDTTMLNSIQKPATKINESYRRGSRDY